MFSKRTFVILLTKFAAKFVLVTTILTLLVFYPIWTAVLTGGFIYLAVFNYITVELALGAMAVLSFSQSVWLAKIKYERHKHNRKA